MKAGSPPTAKPDPTCPPRQVRRAPILPAPKPQPSSPAPPPTASAASSPSEVAVAEVRFSTTLGPADTSGSSTAFRLFFFTINFFFLILSWTTWRRLLDPSEQFASTQSERPHNAHVATVAASTSQPTYLPTYLNSEFRILESPSRSPPLLLILLLLLGGIPLDGTRGFLNQHRSSSRDN